MFAGLYQPHQHLPTSPACANRTSLYQPHQHLPTSPVCANLTSLYQPHQLWPTSPASQAIGKWPGMICCSETKKFCIGMIPERSRNETASRHFIIPKIFWIVFGDISSDVANSKRLTFDSDVCSVETSKSMHAESMFLTSAKRRASSWSEQWRIMSKSLKNIQGTPLVHLVNRSFCWIGT